MTSSWWAENKEDLGQAVGSFAGQWAEALKNAREYKQEKPSAPAIFGGTGGMGGQIGPNAYVYQQPAKEILFQQGPPPPPPGPSALELGISAIGAFAPFFMGCDEKLKVDMAPLETTEVNDALAEAAFFVKGLRECA